jgi:hypothetical protein
MSETRPVTEFTLNFVSAAVWENQNGGKTRFKVTVTKSYRDAEGWKRTNSLDPSDIPYAIKVLDQAHTWEAEERHRRAAGKEEAQPESTAT